MCGQSFAAHKRMAHFTTFNLHLLFVNQQNKSSNKLTTKDVYLIFHIFAYERPTYFPQNWEILGAVNANCQNEIEIHT